MGTAAILSFIKLEIPRNWAGFVNPCEAAARYHAAT
jgi:hypothetical protein